MIDKKKIEMCVTYVRSGEYDAIAHEECWKIFSDLAEQVLEAKMPEKIGNNGYGNCLVESGFNQALDLCRLAIAKDYVKREDVEELVEALDGYVKWFEQRSEGAQKRMSNKVYAKAKSALNKFKGE